EVSRSDLRHAYGGAGRIATPPVRERARAVAPARQVQARDHRARPDRGHGGQEPGPVHQGRGGRELIPQPTPQSPARSKAAPHSAHVVDGNWAYAVCLVIALALIPWREKASACTCPETPSVIEGFKGSDAVFVGTVRAVQRSVARDRCGGDYVEGRVSVSVTVERSWKGVAQGTSVTIATGHGHGDCGFLFRAGSKYLV